MKRILIAGSFALAATGQVFAADLPQAAPPPPRAPAAYIPVAPPVYNWSGIYIGINGGGGFGSSTWNGGLGGSSGSFNTSGFLVGGTLGGNFQAGQFVFGVEGDIDWQSYNGSSTVGCGTIGAGIGAPGVLAPASCETKSEWLSTIRGRVGYAFDRVLLFGTAGGAFGDVEAGLNPSNPFTGTSTFDSSTEFGWTAGAGIEYAFSDNLTAKIEYLYVDLGNKATCSVACTGPGGAVPTALSVSFTENVVRGGINFKFGGF